MSEQLIPLTEVAKVTGRTVLKVRAECEEFGMFISDDWAGRPAISAGDARALVSGQARRAQEQANAWGAHLRDVKKYEDDRDAAVKRGADAAQEKAERQALRRGILSGANGPLSPGEISAARREGAIHAGQQYERRNTRPESNGSRDACKLLYVTPDEEGSALAAAVGAVRGAVKAPKGIEVL